MSPSSVTLQAGQAQQFTASLQGGNAKGLNWSVNNILGGNSSVGTISTTGAYYAPVVTSQTTVTVTVNAPSIGKSASATVTITPVVNISVSPSSATVAPTQSQQLNATVTGTTNTSVTWSLNPAVGTISSSGVYTAPASVSSKQTVGVTATSMANSTKQATANLTVLSSVSISVTPLSATIAVGQNQQFTAAVSGTTNTAVNWSLNPAIGTISSTGLYVAPSSLSSQQTIIVTAVSAADPTKSAGANVTVTPGSAVSISMTPATATLAASQTQQFTASVSGTTNTGVTWTISPLLGTISTSGVYTAPSSITSQQSVTVTATSAADTTKTATAAVTLTPPGLAITTTSLPSGIVNTPYSATLAATGGTTPYSWTLSSGGLPPGLALAMTTGILSGTPTASGTYNMTVQATDAAGHIATAALVVLISTAVCTTNCSSLTITTTSLSNATVGVAYSATLAATGGTTPYTWSISAGALPAGVTLASSGALSGTPTSGGSYSFTAQAADSSSPQNTASQVLSINVAATPATDVYGGLLSLTSPNPATGNWRMEKIGSQWWFIDPLNNAFHFVAPYNVGTGDGNPSPTGTHMANIIYSKYKTDANSYQCGYLPSVVGRLKQWNFTGLGGGSDMNLMSITASSCWGFDSTLNGYYMPQQYRMPTVLYFATSLNAMLGRTWNRTMPPIDQPVKNFNYGINSYIGWGGWLPSAGEADFYDSRLYTYFGYFLGNHELGAAYLAAPAAVQSYVLGALIDEADEMYSFTTGGDNPSLFTGKEHTHGALRLIKTSPLQTANRMNLAIYPDAALYTKSVGLRNYLKSKYTNIAGLNAAWGSSYSACDMEGAGDDFGSCGTKVTNEAFATASTSTATYTHTLAQLTPSWHSVSIYVGGALVAGDLGYNAWENDIYAAPGQPPAGPSKFYGPLVDSSVSTINYSTGAASITFKTGSVGIASISGNGSTVTIKTGTNDSYVAKQHGTWVGAHVTISGTTNYNVAGAVVTSIIDDYTFTISGPGTATETQGTVAFTDTTPSSGAAITVSYVKNGWGIGNGLMDEDGRHTTWLGDTSDPTNAVQLNLATAGVRADLEAFLGQMATQYFSNMATVFGNRFGNGSSRKLLNLGPDPLVYWSSPSHAGVLQAAGKYLDVIGVQSYMQGYPMTQAKLDWIRQNAGDKPLLNVDFILGQADSAMRNFPGEADWDRYSTQAARGTAYYNYVQAFNSFAYTNGGSKPYVGSQFWSWTDFTSDNTNFGLVSPFDNAYDGHESVTGAVACSAPLQSYTCGGEQYNSGNFITPVTAANALWLSSH